MTGPREIPRPRSSVIHSAAGFVAKPFSSSAESATAFCTRRWLLPKRAVSAATWLQPGSARHNASKSRGLNAATTRELPHLQRKQSNGATTALRFPIGAWSAPVTPHAPIGCIAHATAASSMLMSTWVP